MQVNRNYGPPPVNGPQPGGYPQPVTYRPTPAMGYPPDMYQPNRPPVGPGQPGVPQEQPYKYVAQQDVAFGIAGAAAGYFLLPMICSVGGPIGALIGGLALLAISAIVRAVKHGSAKKEAQKQQQQQPNQMPAPPQYPPSYQQRPGAPTQQGYNYQIQYDYGQNKNGPTNRDPYQNYPR